MKSELFRSIDCAYHEHKGIEIMKGKPIHKESMQSQMSSEDSINCNLTQFNSKVESKYSKDYSSQNFKRYD